jgi:hypothetical protein
LFAAFARHGLTVQNCSLIGSAENTVTEVSLEIGGRRIAFRVPAECFVDGSLDATIDVGLAGS